MIEYNILQHWSGAQNEYFLHWSARIEVKTIKLLAPLICNRSRQVSSFDIECIKLCYMFGRITQDVVPWPKLRIQSDSISRVTAHQ